MERGTYPFQVASGGEHKFATGVSVPGHLLAVDSQWHIEKGAGERRPLVWRSKVRKQGKVHDARKTWKEAGDVCDGDCAELYVQLSCLCASGREFGCSCAHCSE
ncbi:hypothetical protein XACW160_630021 [Xanthomonas citri pv. citri]|uniref:Uncharacterized protein n=1 Tax=Xanthomonas citri pv. citri TaxID=611301 RepID=A0A0U5FHZ3_XANCI|nr:hypothetical protein XAC9322_600046 [Xanthomonas citri pv. citri]CEE36018.1 hypothetical protein XAC1083_620042 [Xanthomonas citri pv. citri]CEE46267.1 hypothetical protein XAC902_920005 [Xanthomonas citri pv. citri]CEE48114.1 hypothetical protein XAC908_880002 [Xanthomonas citri pv. citri]CEE50903.1 hypothetical protein XACS584_1060006 [Xanthomonas citri pv. citri]